MRPIILFSGGKDSVYATWCVHHQCFDIACLLTIQPAEPDSCLFHKPLVEYTPLQAEAMGFQHVMKGFPSESIPEFEAFKASLQSVALEHAADCLVSGVRQSSFQKRLIDNVCEQLGLRSVSPLWGKDAKSLLREITESGFRVVVSAVAAYGLDETWIGRSLNNSSIEKLIRLSQKYGFDPAGEGGELETFVVDGPGFKRRIRLMGARTVWRRDSGYLEVTDALLTDKPR